MSDFPFTEEIQQGSKIRIFTAETDPDEMIWHRDREDRTVKVLESDGWYFQMDGELPRELFPGDILEIPKEQWHRMIMKKKTRLVVEVTFKS